MPASKKRPPARSRKGKRRGGPHVPPLKPAVPDAEAEPRTGMPAKDSIIAEESFEAPTGKVYRVIHTNERDEYEEPDAEESKD